MAEVKTNKVAGMSQPEITIIEEKLSMTHGILAKEIATSLSNRFDKILDEMNKVRSELAYIEKTIPGKSDDVKKERIEKIADIYKRLNELKEKRQSSIGKWHKKVIAYIETEYGKPIKSEVGLITFYGEEGRIEVMKNRHLRKIW